jgi:hypothetical protein
MPLHREIRTPTVQTDHKALNLAHVSGTSTEKCQKAMPVIAPDEDTHAHADAS